MSQEKLNESQVDKIVLPYIDNCFDRKKYFKIAFALFGERGILNNYSDYIYRNDADEATVLKLRKRCRQLIEAANAMDHLRGRQKITLRSDDEAMQDDGENKKLYNLDMIEHSVRDFHAVGNNKVRLDKKLRDKMIEKIEYAEEHSIDLNLFDIYHETIVRLYRKYVK